MTARRPLSRARLAYLDRLETAERLRLAIVGGCPECETEPDEMCAGCGRCRCHTHATCTRPTTDVDPGGPLPDGIG